MTDPALAKTRKALMDYLPLLLGLALGGLLVTIIALPDRWTGAVVVRICRDGTPLLRLRDGAVWIRRGLNSYQVEDFDKVCGHD